MPSVTIQFHMLFDEIVTFLAEMMSRYSLAAELERFYPKSVSLVPPEANLDIEVARFGRVDRVWLLWKPPRARKYERFHLHVGRVRGERMEQSHLSAGTDKPDAFKILKSIAQQLKQRTKAGIWVIGETGNVGYSKNFRVSTGAADAARQGKMTLTAPGFTQTFRVDPPR